MPAAATMPATTAASAAITSALITCKVVSHFETILAEMPWLVAIKTNRDITHITQHHGCGSLITLIPVL
jgi:hypothetical protein